MVTSYILLYLHLSSSRYLTSQAGSFSHVLLKCSFTFGSSDLFGRYSKCAWDSDLSAQDCYTTYLNYYGTVSSRLWVKQPAKRTKPFSNPKPLFCFGGVGPRPQFWAVEKSLGLLLSLNCQLIKRPCNFSLRGSQWPIIGAKIFSSGIKEGLGESLPRTQTSLSRWTFARSQSLAFRTRLCTENEAPEEEAGGVPFQLVEWMLGRTGENSIVRFSLRPSRTTAPSPPLTRHFAQSEV